MLVILEFETDKKTRRNLVIFFSSKSLLFHNLFHQVLRHPEEMLLVVLSNAGSF